MIKIINVKSLYSALYNAVEICKANKDMEIEIIVPDKLSLFMEKFLFEQMYISASFNIKVSTLNRFAKKSCVVSKEKQISKVGSILLINKILNDNLNNLEILKSKAYSFSYAEEIFNTISQLKSSKINFDEMKKFASSNAQLTGKIKDLALVYEEYETRKEGLLDAADVFLMSALFVAKGNENKKLIFVGFDDFTAIEYAIVERLAVVCDVNLINYYSNDKNKYIYNYEVFDQLKHIAYINDLPFECEEGVETGNELINFLERNIYSLNRASFVLKDKIVKVFNGNKIDDELEFVARDIRSKILSGGRFDDYGVAIFGLEDNTNKVKQIFEKYEINYYIDSEISISKSVLYKFFVSILKYNFDGYNLSHLIDIINSPFNALSSDGKRKIVQKLISLNYRGKIKQDIEFDIPETDREELFRFMNIVSFDKNDSVSAVIEKLKNLEIDFDAVLDKIKENSLDAKILLNKSKEVIFDLFDEIINHNCCENAGAFLDVFTHIVGVVKVNNLPLNLDAVKIVDANNSMEIFKDLYIVGANQDCAPNLKFDCGIILDNEIEQLNFSHKLSPAISHINKLARLRLFNSVLMFDNDLTISYSKTASDIINELLDKVQVQTEQGIINIKPISNFNFGKYYALTKWDYIDYLCKNEKNNKKINENIIKNKEFLNLNDENLKIYNDFNQVSATTLENYFKCPMYAFFANILKIKPNLKVEILSLDIGNVLHEILFKYYKLNKKVDDLYEFCKTEVFNCVEKEQRLKLNIDNPILINLIDEAVRVLNAVNYIDTNSDFVPKYFEYDFRGDRALSLKNISIVGKVDRVDIFNDMFRIVDYKSGKADASLKELYYGNKLQLFLYSCAMENVLKKNSVGAFYMPLHNAYTKELGNTYSMKGFYLAEDFVVKSFDRRLEAGMKSDIVNVTLTKTNSIRKTIGYKELASNEIGHLKEYSKLVSEQAIDEMKSGFIAPTPSEVSKPCQYCPYVHICLKSSNEICYREARKVNLESFKEADNDWWKEVSRRSERYFVCG